MRTMPTSEAPSSFALSMIFCLSSALLICAGPFRGGTGPPARSRRSLGV